VHDIRVSDPMISKLPPWIELGGFLLALIAGSVNAAALLGFQHQAVSHLTGITTLLGMKVVFGDLPAAGHLLLVVACFVVGAIISGILIRDEVLQLGRRYGAALLLEAAMLLLAMATLNRGSTYGHFFVSVACGLQNAMATTYSGAVLRTTHVTGLFTDLGIVIGHRIRGIGVDPRRVKMYLVLILGYFVGCVVGTFSFIKVRYFALNIPAGIALALGLGYWGYWLLQKRKPDTEA
jgi:uncharacterized membrane protein YoaK (UPF0700 family)